MSEADEVSQEDLEAAAELFDRTFPVWTRSNGKKIYIKDMTDHHLLGAIKKMRDAGKYAQADIERIVKFFFPVVPEGLEVDPLLDAMVNLAYDRGLMP